MEIRHYRSFIALAEEKSFTAAARRLNIVQSGLSATIREMEEELGTLLVNRTTRRVSLTEAGQLFLEYARPGLAVLNDGLQAVRSQSQIVRGRLRLGILQCIEPYVDLPAVLSQFHALYPEVDFTVRSVDSIRAPELIRSGDLDLSFHAQIATGSLSGVEAVPFATDALVAVCASSHSIAARKNIASDKLLKLPFVDLTNDRALRVLIDKTFAKLKVARRSVYEVNSVATMLQLVSNGLGVTILPSALAATHASALELRSLPLDERQHRLPRWCIVVLARPLKQGLSGKTLPELMLGTLSDARRASAELS